MGCTIDYGILLSTNYTNYRQTLNKFDAAKAAFKSSIGAISLSASILTMVGFAVGLVGSIPRPRTSACFWGWARLSPI